MPGSLHSCCRPPQKGLPKNAPPTSLPSLSPSSTLARDAHPTLPLIPPRPPPSRPPPSTQCQRNHMAPSAFPLPSGQHTGAQTAVTHSDSQSTAEDPPPPLNHQQDGPLVVTPTSTVSHAVPGVLVDCRGGGSSCVLKLHLCVVCVCLPPSLPHLSILECVRCGTWFGSSGGAWRTAHAAAERGCLQRRSSLC